jgi:hypothetical protein
VDTVWAVDDAIRYKTCTAFNCFSWSFIAIADGPIIEISVRRGCKKALAFIETTI